MGNKYKAERKEHGEDMGWPKELWTLTLFNPLEAFSERKQVEHCVCVLLSSCLVLGETVPVCLSLCKSVLEIWVSELCSSYGWKFQHFELSHSFPFSSFLLGLYLILVVSHQLLHHRRRPALLPHKVSLGECADSISSLLRECLLFLIHVVLVLCCSSITKIAVTFHTYAGFCPVIHRSLGHPPFN